MKPDILIQINTSDCALYQGKAPQKNLLTFNHVGIDWNQEILFEKLLLEKFEEEPRLLLCGLRHVTNLSLSRR